MNSASAESAFGGWLKGRRRELGITQEELAGHINCSLITLQKLEAGERRPSRQVALLIADHFSIPLDEREAFITFARTGHPLHGNGKQGDRASGDGAGDAGRSPWRLAYFAHTNLPTVLTALIGREREEAAICDLIGQSRVRLLTLVGPLGIGKTRLSLQVGSDLLPHFEDGVYFVDLAPVTQPDLVVPTVARVLGLSEMGGQPLLAMLQQHLRDKRMLLVLDNFEQVLDAAPEVVQLLQGSPWLKVLTTSREALHIRGERSFPVSPLEVPHISTDTKALASSPAAAMELFVERAQAVKPDFDLTEDNARDVAAICVGLDGLPLSIELAAAQAGLLAPHQILAALDSRLTLLANGYQDLPARQRTLRSTIDWSYNLLDVSEQRLFSRLGVFAGGCTVEAVEAVCNLEGQPSGQVSDAISPLVRKSLLKQDERRLAMLQTIREYALERLDESGESLQMQNRHADYYLELAEQIEPQLFGAAQEESAAQLEREHDNLRAALAWTLSQRQSAKQADGASSSIVALRLGVALSRFWYLRGHLTEGRRWLEAILQGEEPPADNSGDGDAFQASRIYRARAFNGAGNLAWNQGDYEAAHSLFEQGLGLARAAEDKQTIARLLCNLGIVEWYKADYGAARRYYEQGLELARELGEGFGIGVLLNNVGTVAHVEGDYDAARQYYRESLEMAREQGSKASIAKLLNNLGSVEVERGDYSSASALHEESLQLSRQLEDRPNTALTLNHLGIAARMAGDFDKAEAYHRQALALFRELGNKGGMTESLNSLGALAAERGDYGSAESLHKEGLALFEETGEKLRLPMLIEGLAGTAAHLGDPERAARLFGAADTLRKSSGAPVSGSDRTRIERQAETARSQLTPAQWGDAYKEGSAMSAEQAVAYAMGQEPAEEHG